MAGLRFTVAQLLACSRIGFDLCHSLLRPLFVPPGPIPDRRSRPRERAVELQPPNGHQRLRVVSWNIHRSYQGAQIRQSLKTLLQSEDPDIVLLQEVPVYQEAPFWGLDQLRDLLAGYHLEYVTMHSVKRPTTYYSFSETGLLTISKAAPLAVEAIPLPTVTRHKLGHNHTIRRVALVTQHAFADQVICVCHLHLENTTGPQGRALQVSYLLDRLDHRDRPITVLAGDFNTLFGGREKLHEHAAAHGFAPVSIADRSRLLPALDHFFVHGCTGHRGRSLKLPGSDHRPILFELR